MENATNTTEHLDTTRLVILEITTSFLTLIVLYILFCLLWYERTLLRNSSRKRKSSRKTAKYAVAMRVQSILAPVFFLGRLATDHYELLAQYLQRDPHDFCNVTWIVRLIFSAFSISMVYLFLWTRQSYCYSDKAMRHLTTRVTTTLSWATLALILVAEITCTILFGATRFYRLTAKGCVLDKTTIPENIPWIVLAVSTVGFQALLCGLFLYPLLKHRSVGTSSIRGFMPLFRRTTIIAALCISNDITAAIIILSVNNQSNLITDLVYALNIMISVLLVVAAFRDWKLRLFPMCGPKCSRWNGMSLEGETNQTSFRSRDSRKFAPPAEQQAVEIKTISNEATRCKRLDEQEQVHVTGV
ncbi:uncharacterized protein LOC144745713 [Ciona intestinalis]